MFYFGIRVSEALKLTPENFTIVKDRLFVDIGHRLKGSRRTPTLNIPLNRPFVSKIVKAIERTHVQKRVWNFSRMTGYRTIRELGLNYPHFLRLSRITNLLNRGVTLDEIKSFTGLSLNALDYYVGIAKIDRIGEKL